MINLIRQDKYYFFAVLVLITAIFWFFNFSHWYVGWLNVLFFLIYFFLNACWLGKILNKFIKIEKRLQIFLGLFLLFYFVAFIVAVPAFLYKILPIYLFAGIFFLTIIISLLHHLEYFNNQADVDSEFLDDDAGIKVSKFFYIIFAILYCLSLAMLFRSRVGGFILSPWETIRPYYLYFWFGVSFITVLFIFSREKVWKILCLIIFASLLLHAYLPIIYQAGFGGDKWRHLGAERWLMEGKIYSPALFGEKLSLKQIGPLKVPEVLVVGNKNSYVNMWGATIALSWLLKVDVFWVDLILGYLLYSVFLPLLLFKFGQFFISKKPFLLLLGFLPLCFSPFQVYGSITMPNSFGFLWFLFTLIFLLNILTKKTDGWQKTFVIFLVLLNYFNYILYFLLLLEILALVFLLKKFSQTPSIIWKIILAILIIIFILLFILLIPGADKFSGNSIKSLTTIRSNFSSSVVDFGKRLLVSQAIFPREMNMEQDNWLFLQINQFLNRAIFLKLVPWFLILTPLVCLLCLVGILTLKRMLYKRLGVFFLIFLIIILANQVLATYFMDGNHIFSKRLVIMHAFLMMIFLGWGIVQWVSRQKFSSLAKVVTVATFLSLLSMTVYASGPKMQTVTADELKATQYLWDRMKTSSTGPYCVLANTWPLLALESESGRQITTGGFPFYYEYRQPERVQLFAQMNKEPSVRYLEKSLEITKAKDCYFMTEERWIYIYRKSFIISQLNKLFGQAERVGDVYIWRYQP